MLRTLPVVMTITAALLAMPCAADDDVAEVQIEKVSLVTSEGVIETYEKLEISAKRACRDTGVTGRSLTSLRVCQQHVLNQFVREIDSRVLTTLHEAKRSQ